MLYLATTSTCQPFSGRSAGNILNNDGCHTDSLLAPSALIQTISAVLFYTRYFLLIKELPRI